MFKNISNLKIGAKSAAQIMGLGNNPGAVRKRGSSYVIEAVENISAIAKSNLSAVQRLSLSAKDLRP